MTPNLFTTYSTAIDEKAMFQLHATTCSRPILIIQPLFNHVLHADGDAPRLQLRPYWYSGSPPEFVPKNWECKPGCWGFRVPCWGSQVGVTIDQWLVGFPGCCSNPVVYVGHGFLVNSAWFCATSRYNHTFSSLEHTILGCAAARVSSPWNYIVTP